MRKFLLIFIILIIVLGTLWFFIFKNNSEVIDEKNIDKQTSTKTKIESEPQLTLEELLGNDKDSDGIADEEEKNLGTSDYQFDTDGDSLSDKDEIEVWKTDPLNPDTDGDGFFDGMEVIKGYNPAGAGTL
jgi:hypothetical protein